MKKYIHFGVNLGLFLMLSACFSQKAPIIEGPVQSVQDQLRSKECRPLRLSSDVLLHDNILTFFRCTGDDQKFPALYQAIVQSTPEAWNHLLGPWDDLYFDNRIVRERTLGLFRDLDRKQGLDDLGHILSALNDKNLWDALYQMLPDPQGENQNALLSKDDYKSFFANLRIDKDNVGDIITSLNGIIEAAKSPMPGMTSFMRKMSPLEEFQQARVGIINGFFDLWKLENVNDKDRYVFPRLFSDDGKNPSYLVALFGSERFHPSYVKEMLDFPFTVYPSSRAGELAQHQILHDLKWLLRMGEGEKCACADSSQINFLFSDELHGLMRSVGEGREDQVQSYLTEMPWKMAMADQGCDLYQSLWQDKQWDIKNTLAKTQVLLQNPTTFDLLVYFQSLAKEVDDDFYWLRMASGVVPQLGLDMLTLASSVGADIAGPVASFANHLPLWVFPSLARSMDYFLSPDHLAEMEIIGKFWKALPYEHQVYLLKIIDAHFAEGTNPQDLFQFYQSMIQEFPETLPFIKKHYAENDEQLEKTYISFFKLAQAHHGEAVLSDLRKWFSRDQILKVVQFLSSQVPVTTGFNVEEITESHGLFAQEMGRMSVATLNLDIESIYACQNKTANLNLKELIVSFPEECQVLKDQMPLAIILSGLYAVEYSYQSRFPDRSLLHSQGVMSNASIQSSVENLYRLEHKWSWTSFKGTTFPGGLSGLLAYLAEVVADYPRWANDLWATLMKIISASSELLAHPENEHNPARDLIHDGIGQIVDYPHVMLNQHLATFGDLIEKYEVLPDPKKIIFDQNWSCPNVLKLDLGPAPRCPGQERLASKLAEALNILTRKFPGQPRLGEQMIESLNPHGQLKIPYESKKAHQYSTDMEEILVWAYDLGSQKRKVDFIIRPTTETTSVWMTNADLIDAVIREISFMDNVYGSMWVNEVARAEDYDKVVDKQKGQIKLLKVAGGLMRKLPRKDEDKLEHWLPEGSKERLKNSVTTYEGLKSNNYKYPDTRPYAKAKTRQHGDFIIALMTMLTSSSAKESQDISTFKLPHDPKLGANHNGLFLVKLTELYGNAHTNRWIRSRLGEDDKALNEFLSSWKFRRVNDRLIPGLNFEILQEHFIEFAKSYQGADKEEWNQMISDVIKDISDIPDDTLMELEALLGEVVVTASFIGPQDEYRQHKEKYRDLNLADLLAIAPMAKDLYYQMKRFEHLIDWKDGKLIRQMRQALNLFNRQLSKVDDGDDSYILLNEGFRILKQWLFTEKDQSFGFEKLLTLIQTAGPDFDHALQSLKLQKQRLERSAPENVSKNFVLQVANNLKSLEGEQSFDALFIRQYLKSSLASSSPSYLEWERILVLAKEKEDEFLGWIENDLNPAMNKLAVWLHETFALISLQESTPR